MASAALQALIFDVDGTLADTEPEHLAAFTHAYQAAPLQIDHRQHRIFAHSKLIIDL